MRRAGAAALALSGALLAAACAQFADNRVKSGLGTACTSDETCQASTCVQGVCVIPCPTDPGDACPDGTVCAEGLCHVPLAVGFIYPGQVAQEEYTLSFDRGRNDVRDALAYTSLAYVEDVSSASAVLEAANTFLTQDRRVMIGISPSYGPLLADVADARPEATFFVAGSRVTRDNLVSFDARAYQAYFLAGIAAAEKTTTRRLGMIGSTYSPSTVASINAFTLGARSVDPTIVVELRWIGAPHDAEPPVAGKSRERVFTEELVSTGADVIAHTLDNNIPVYTVAEIPGGSLAIGANVADVCSINPNRCLGSVFYNWGPLLVTLLDGFHRQELPPGRAVLESIQVSNAATPVGFLLSGGVVGAPAIQQTLDVALTALASDEGVGRVFDGPIQSTGQCESATGEPICVADGERLDDARLFEMCWLVQGLVERQGGVDVPASMPLLGDCAPTD